MRQQLIELPSEVSPQSVAGYVRLFQLETWLRELVYLDTKAHFGKVWWTECNTALVRSNGRGIPADKSLSRDKLHPHMATPENDPLWFLSFDGLLKIVFDEQLWPIFECYLTTKELLKQKFTEISPIRNRCGHNRAMHEDDLDRIRRLLRDLDKGFWRFCSSFNDKQPFIAELRTDSVYQTFKDRMCVDFVEVAPKQWAQVGDTREAKQNVMVMYSRPARWMRVYSQPRAAYITSTFRSRPTIDIHLTIAISSNSRNRTIRWWRTLSWIRFRDLSQ